MIKPQPKTHTNQPELTLTKSQLKNFHLHNTPKTPSDNQKHKHSTYPLTKLKTKGKSVNSSSHLCVKSKPISLSSCLPPSLWQRVELREENNNNKLKIAQLARRRRTRRVHHTYVPHLPKSIGWRKITHENRSLFKIKTSKICAKNILQPIVTLLFL